MRTFVSLLIFSCFCAVIHAQEPVVIRPVDTPVVRKASPVAMNRYDSANKAHRPGKAALRSAILPGWLAGRNRTELQPVTREIGES